MKHLSTGRIDCHADRLVDVLDLVFVRQIGVEEHLVAETGTSTWADADSKRETLAVCLLRKQLGNLRRGRFSHGDYPSGIGCFSSGHVFKPPGTCLNGGLYSPTRTIGLVPTLDVIRNALRDVIDPELGDDIVSLGMVRDIQLNGGIATVTVALTIAGCPLRTQLTEDVTARVGALAGIDRVRVEMGEMTREERTAVMSRARWKARESAPVTQVPSRTRVLAIASGKGGVGKSSVTANLAAAIASTGLTVGVLDADIAGFSLPRMFGAEERLAAFGGKMVPLRMAIGSGQLEIVSMGLIQGSGEDEAVMFRGLMLNRALQHFLEDVQWGDLDYLLVDMPPGTGDVQMGLARMMPRASLIVVTTPALGAQQVAARAVDMARRGHLRVAGIVENMSAFTTAGGERLAVFGEGGGSRLSSTTGAPLLAEIPLDPEFSRNNDNGELAVLRSQGSEVKKAFIALGELITSDIAPIIEMAGCTSRLLEAAAAALDKIPPAPNPRFHEP